LGFCAAMQTSSVISPLARIVGPNALKLMAILVECWAVIDNTKQSTKCQHSLLWPLKVLIVNLSDVIFVIISLELIVQITLNNCYVPVKSYVV